MRKMSKLLFILLAMNSAYAMRCGDKLVYEGDTQYTLLQKCGEPKDKLIYDETTPLYNYAGYQIGVTTVTVEMWVYQRSSADFEYDVYFNNGKIKEIKSKRNP